MYDEGTLFDANSMAPHRTVPFDDRLIFSPYVAVDAAFATAVMLMKTIGAWNGNLMMMACMVY